VSTTVRTDEDCGGFDLSAILLKSGGHSANGYHGECCMVEASNRAAACIPALRDKYGAPAKFEADHPSICPVISSFCISYNDGLRSDEERTRLLKPYVTRILGTKRTAKDERIRSWMATDWLVRVQAPAWLDLAGLTGRATKLRQLPELTNAEIARGVQSVLNGARDDAAVARAAAWAAAGDAAEAVAEAAAGAVARAAAWDAAGAVAKAAAGAAAWAVAWDAAWAVAWDAAEAAAGAVAEAAAGAAAGAAARAAAWDAARAAAGAAAGAAAWAAAEAVAWDAAWAAAGAAAWAAAEDAAKKRLEPTVILLQASALELLDRMILVGATERAA
jgi:hypothetical protein